MVRVELKLGGVISVNGGEIAPGPTFALLDAIRTTSSVSGAADRLRLSYRTAWGRVEALQMALGHTLVTKTKGHGSKLSPAGLGLCDALGAVLQEFEGPLAAAEASLARRLAGLVEATTPRLRVAVSHDPLVLDVLGAMADAVDVATTGSSDAVAKLFAGEVDVAGFHFGGVSPQPPPGSVFTPLFNKDSFTILSLFRREQGLILAADNPLQIRSLGDLCSTGARLVNRQRGSGTRLWFDRLLAEAGLSASSIRGYGVEEFTHQAVAAVVASGAADTGMGVRAAAERFGLSFVQLGLETYFFAAPRSVEDRLDVLVAAVRSQVAETTGYGLV